MTSVQTENPLLTELGTHSAMDAIHHVFVLLHLNSLEAIKNKESYAPEFICELSDWMEVLPTYMQRQDADAVEDFRLGLDAISHLHPCFRSVLRRFDDRMGYSHPLVTEMGSQNGINGVHK